MSHEGKLGKIRHAIAKARASVNPTEANAGILEEAHAEIERLLDLKARMTEQLGVFAFFAEKMPEPQIGEPDWHGMAKDAREITKSAPAPLAKIENEWWVVSTVISKAWLMLECKVTGKTGYVKNPSKAEWNAAFHAPSHPYLWHDHSRVDTNPEANEKDKVHSKLCELETNLNCIQEHIRDGLSGGTLGDRAQEIKRHAVAAKKAFDWIDNFTTIKGLDTTPAQEWMHWCGVADMRELASSEKFKELIEHADFETAQGWLIHNGMLIVVGTDSWWAWETPGGPCVIAGTLFPTNSQEKTVCCKFCHKQVPEATAHLHDGGWVGDECCWDSRLRSSE